MNENDYNRLLSGEITKSMVNSSIDNAAGDDRWAESLFPAYRSHHVLFVYNGNSHTYQPFSTERNLPERADPLLSRPYLSGTSTREKKTDRQKQKMSNG